jgi:hypothetical protein
VWDYRKVIAVEIVSVVAVRIRASGLTGSKLAETVSRLADQFERQKGT